MSIANEIDDRTVEEQLRDLGVEVIRKNSNAVTGVKWVQKNKKHSKPGKPMVRVNKKGLYINTYATKMLKPNGKQYDFGTGNYQGKRVILLRESKSGYKFSIARKDGSEYATTHTPGLVKQLLSAGIKQGRYILYEIRGGWMGVPEK